MANPNQLTWQELLQSIAEGLREPDLLTSHGQDSGETETPYHDADTIEGWLYRASLMVLREVPAVELEAIGSSGVTAVSAIPNADVPLDVYAITTATIQQDVAGAFVRAEAVHPAVYFEQLTVPKEAAAIYTVYGGKVRFKGQTINITYRREPLLGEFQDDDPILPPGYDDARIDIVHKLALGEDFMPAGRM